MDMRFALQDRDIALAATAEGDGWRVRLPDGGERLIMVRRLDDETVEVCEKSSAGQKVFRASVAATDRGIEVAWHGHVFVFTSAESGRSTAKKSSGSLASPMPGIVVDVLVAAGQEVEAYQPLAVVEAMKVMATVEAPFAGKVARVNTSKGARVRQGEILVELEAISDERGEPTP